MAVTWKQIAFKSDVDAKADKGANSDITSMAGLNDDGIPGAKIVAASETSEGVSEKATNEETLAGTDDVRHVTPAKLQYVLDRMDYYGVSWDESADSYSRTGKLVGLAVGQTLSAALLPVQSLMRRCVINDSGVVQYYLDPSDSTKKEDGTASVLTGADGQVMVEIPSFYYKYGYTGTTHTWEISLHPLSGFSIHPAFFKNDEFVTHRYVGAYEGSMWDASTSAMVPSGSIATDMYTAGDKLCSYSAQYPKTNEKRSEFRGMAASRGTGWRQAEYDIMSAIYLLFLTEYASFYAHSLIGVGRTGLYGGTWTAGSYIGQCGKSNGDGNGTNSVSGNLATAYMTYRGVENLFGNVWQWIDGININAWVPYACNKDTDFADDTSTNYTSLGIVTVMANGWQNAVEQQSRGFLPASVGASSSTKVCAYYYQANFWCVFAVGGNTNAGEMLRISANNPSTGTGTNMGGRLAY